jgi:Ger(x)C family germination protein
MIRGVFILVAILMMLLTGCWDKVELDKRTFVLGVAVDTVSESGRSKAQEFNEKSIPDMYMVTLETPPAKQDNKQSSNGSEGSGGGSEQKTKLAVLYRDTGNTIFEVIRKMATESDRILFFGQQQVLIIGEELVRKYEISKVLDFWSRDPEVDRSMKVIIARGRADKIFNADAKHSQTVSMFIKDQMTMVQKTSRFIDTDIIEVIRKMAGNDDLLIGSIALLEDNSLRISGSAVIKDGKLRGWLDEDETRAVQLATGEVKGGEIALPNPERKGCFTAAEITDVKTQLKANVQGEIPAFTISIRMQCNIAEIDHNIRRMDENDFIQIEKAISDIVEKQAKATVEKVQKQYEADVLGFEDRLKKHHYKEWKRISKNWDELFAQVPVSIKVSTKVERSGASY